ncbi:cytochrome c biogenesis CcdA family protein [Corynebacterium epidermidicanis]|uniref:Cytochrome c biogenesis protein n=1 Tax=Corynebacterium epidermidicanis TaxID=1050174 RepID=A0A0G3GR32_9CORY|nr:cytochrome c biogenesis CcdA family protein [Corynebacterium epidermidicanis]AKK03616.1 cytochrome c biogenesis protein [Corynebacterium epidermidicanis]
MVSVGIFGAFLGGVLSLLSPCSALLLPAFFAYAFQSARQLLLRTSVFFAGLSLVLVPIGMGLGWAGSLLAGQRSTLITAGGWLVIALGVLTFFGGGFRIPFLSSLNSRVSGVSWLSVFLLGAVYGFAGFCAGPLLGAVLTTATVTGSAIIGALVMLSYAFGMALPLFLLAWLWDSRRLGSVTWLRGRVFHFGPLRLHTTSAIAGALFVLIGWMFLATHGTSGLPSLVSVDQQLCAQAAVLGFVRGKELLLAIVTLAILLVMAMSALIRSTRERDEA